MTTPPTPERPAITTPADAETHRDAIAEFASELWETDPTTGRVSDWEGWADRFERQTGIDLPGQWDDPAMRAVKRIAKAAIAEVV